MNTPSSESIMQAIGPNAEPMLTLIMKYPMPSPILSDGIDSETLVFTAVPMAP